MDKGLRRRFLKEFRTATLKQLTQEFKTGPALGSRREDPSVIMALHVLLAGSIAAAPTRAYDRVVNALLHATHERKLHQWR